MFIFADQYYTQIRFRVIQFHPFLLRVILNLTILFPIEKYDQTYYQPQIIVMGSLCCCS